MKKEFIPYEQALALKALGFDESCMGVYYGDEDDMQFVLDVRETQYYAQKGYKDGILAPTFSQVFRWFREKCGLIGLITTFYSKDNFRFAIYAEHIGTEDYNTYEEAELACLKKLIEMAHPNK
jgi:hypothetical protein